MSLDNYGDTTNYVDGKNKTDKKLTRIVNVIDHLSDSEWTTIYEDAYTVHSRRQQETRGGRITSTGPVTDGRGEDAPQEEANSDAL